MKPSPVSLPTLLNQLTDASSQVRLQAIKDIMRLRTEHQQATTALLAMLSDPDERACKAAITASATLRDVQAVPALGQIVTHHPRAPLRLSACKALVEINYTQARPYVLAALHSCIAGRNQGWKR